MSILYDVPQGTTLLSALFNTHINKINYLDIHWKVICYTDDMVLLFIEDESWEEIFGNVRDLRKNIKLSK